MKRFGNLLKFDGKSFIIEVTYGVLDVNFDFSYMRRSYKTMSKRILALLLCAVMLVPCLAGCAKEDPDNPDIGPYITMYLTDEIYDLDPATAVYNKESQNIASMLFETLFTLDKKGKVKKSLVKDCTIDENEQDKEYSMTLVLKEAYWSNKTLVTSDDVVFTFKRLLNSNNSFASASLLFDIKNARAVKEGDCSIDDLGVEAVEQDTIKITFEVCHLY